MIRTLLLCTLFACVAACGRAEGGGDDTDTPDAAATEPDAGVDAAPPAVCAADGDTCADGSKCFEGACGGAKVIAVSAQCALRASGSVWCWGYNEFGVSGDPARSASCAGTPCTPAPVKVAGLDDVTAIVDDGGSACALRKDGSVWCWGRNNLGQLGHDPASDASCGAAKEHCATTPTKVAGVQDVQSIDSNFATTCAVTTAGTVYCWGANNVGQLGRGDFGAFKFAAGAVKDLTGVTQISLGTSAACARTKDKRAWCWGWSHAVGNLGHLYTDDPMCGNDHCRTTPARVEKDANGGVLDDVLTVAIGDVEACVIRAGGTVWCWGHGGYCQLGKNLNTADTVSNAAPVQIGGFPFAVDVLTAQHTCVRSSDGEIWCSGLAYAGQLGNGQLTGSGAAKTGGWACELSPVRVPLIKSSQMALRTSHVTSVAPDGTVSAWGNNRTAELGHARGSNGDVACYEGSQCNGNPKPVALP